MSRSLVAILYHNRRKLVIFVGLTLILFSFFGELSNVSLGKTSYRPAVVPLTPAMLEKIDPEHYQSQGGQDQLVLTEIFSKNVHKNSGVFIEFGARDGIEHSNTYLFAREFGWKGLMAEPDRNEQKNISTNRPEAAVFDGGFCEQSGRKSFLSSSIPGWSGISDGYDSDRKGNPGHISVINCFRLLDITTYFGIKHVNYLAVDVEGNELPALRAFPFDSVTVDVVGVEVLKGNAERQKKEKEVVEYMKSKGFKIHKELRFADDTSDFFFVPIKPKVVKGPFYDNDRFEKARATCRFFQRCL